LEDDRKVPWVLLGPTKRYQEISDGKLGVDRKKTKVF